MARVTKAFLFVSLSVSVHAAAAALLVFPRARPDAAPTATENPPAKPEPGALTGETFEIPVPEADDTPPAAAAGHEAPPETSRASAPPGTTPPKDDGERPKPPAAPAGKNTKDTTAPAAEAPGHDGTGGAGSSLYGAAGDKSAVDLATAFTRGFPQAASADPAWAQAAMGPAGEVTVTLTLDETGKLVESVVSPGASPALAAGVKRTLALVGARTFTSKSKVTKLQLVATISKDEVHDGLHGDVFAIGGSYTGSEGQAFFALAIGRRIDLKVRPR